MLRPTQTLRQQLPQDIAHLARLLARSVVAHAFTKEAMIRMSARAGQAGDAARGWLVMVAVTKGWQIMATVRAIRAISM